MLLTKTYFYYLMIGLALVLKKTLEMGYYKWSVVGPWTFPTLLLPPPPLFLPTPLRLKKCGRYFRKNWEARDTYWNIQFLILILYLHWVRKPMMLKTCHCSNCSLNYWQMIYYFSSESDSVSRRDMAEATAWLSKQRGGYNIILCTLLSRLFTTVNSKDLQQQTKER